MFTPRAVEARTAPAMPKRTSLDWALEIVSLAVLAAIFLTLATYWPELPNRVPRHYGFAGNPNNWGNRDWMWVLPVTATVIYLSLTVAARYPGLINLPLTVNRDRPEVRKLLLNMTLVLKATILFTLAYINWIGIHIALGRAETLGPIFLPVFLAVTFGPIVFYTQKLWRYRV
jgi:hypothetical protein